MANEIEGVKSRGSPIRIFGADHRLLEAVMANTDHRSRGLFEAFYLSCSIINSLSAINDIFHF